VIDTSHSLLYLNQLSVGNNIGFTKRMSVPLFSKISGKLWLDAAYGRDYLATSPLVDSTAFTISCKNGDDPNNWQGGSTNIPDKNDLVDLYAHMRRDGTDIDDSLWLFTGVSTEGTSGSRYFDIELYKKSFTYSRSSGVFNSAGTDAGHTQWLFDASGNVLQMGDLILAVSYSPGSAPVVDVRIWVSQATFSSVSPNYFDFGATLDGATPGFGYTSVLSNSGTTAFGAGIANFSATPAQDTTFSTPWGTETPGKTWGTQYESLQLIEIGLNLTRMGLDPALYKSVGLSPCTSMFSTIFFKSRSSNSFTSNMQDFMMPMVFQEDPVMDYTVNPDTLRCNRSTGTISLGSGSTAGYYSWQTPDGNISAANPDSSQINLTKPGTYILSASPIQGCPFTRNDTLVVPIDTFPPVASILSALGPASAYFRFFGGDVAASNYPTPFGGSSGLLWDWSGPGGFTSNIQNPVTADTIWGNYQLVVQEIRNGCTDTIIEPITRNLFFLLADNNITLEGILNEGDVLLKWQDKVQLNAQSYTIEKSGNGRDFKPIGAIQNSGDQEDHNFVDHNPSPGQNFYRIRIVTKSGLIAYSNTIAISNPAKNSRKVYLTNNPSGTGMALAVENYASQKATIVITTVSGEKLRAQTVQLTPGFNYLPLDTIWKNPKAIWFVTLYLNNQIVFTGKMLN